MILPNFNEQNNTIFLGFDSIEINLVIYSNRMLMFWVIRERLKNKIFYRGGGTCIKNGFHIFHGALIISHFPSSGRGEGVFVKRWTTPFLLSVENSSHFLMSKLIKNGFFLPLDNSKSVTIGSMSLR